MEHIEIDSDKVVLVRSNRDWIAFARAMIFIFLACFGLFQITRHAHFDPKIFFATPFLLIALWSGIRGFFNERLEIGNGIVKYVKKSWLGTRRREEKLSDFTGIEAVIKQVS